MINETNGGSRSGNRFVVKRTDRKPYTSSVEFVQAMGEHLTPDIWDAIIARAIRDAMFGKSADRTKAREFLSKYLLSERKENLLDRRKPMPDSTGALFAEIFELLRDSFYRNVHTDDEEYGATRNALGLTLARLSPDERQLFRDALAMSESPEAQGWFKTMEQKIDSAPKNFEDNGPVRIYLPAKSKLSG